MGSFIKDFQISIQFIKIHTLFTMRCIQYSEILFTFVKVTTLSSSCFGILPPWLLLLLTSQPKSLKERLRQYQNPLFKFQESFVFCIIRSLGQVRFPPSLKRHSYLSISVVIALKNSKTSVPLGACSICVIIKQHPLPFQYF